MPYCEAADVQAEFRGLEIGEGTVISSAKMDEFISQASQEIDARLAIKYRVPITGTESLKVLKQIAVWLVASRVRQILELKMQSPNTGQDIQSRGLRKDALAMLDDIITGRLLLSDAIMPNAGGIQSINVSKNQKHQFKRNKDQW